MIKLKIKKSFLFIIKKRAKSVARFHYIKNYNHSSTLFLELLTEDP